MTEEEQYDHQKYGYNYELDQYQGELERYLRDGAYMFTDDQLRHFVQMILNDWARESPEEVKAAMAYVRSLKENWSHNKTGLTGAGEHVLGAFPQVLAVKLAQILNDPHWMQNNKKLLGIIFDEFQVGRIAFWEGRGKGGAGSRLNLNEGDRV